MHKLHLCALMAWNDMFAQFLYVCFVDVDWT